MNKKLSKEEVKGPDAFIAFSDKAIEHIEKHRKPILVILATAFILGLSFVAIKFIFKKNEQKAQFKLYTIESEYKKRSEELVKKTEDKKDLTADYGKIIDDYSQFINEYSGSKASYIAALSLADIYDTYNEYSKTFENLKKVTGSLKPDSFFYGLIFSKMGSALLALKKYEDAIQQFQKVVDAKGQTHLRADSLLKIGLSYQQMNNEAKAVEAFERITRDFAESDAAAAAKSYIRLINLKKGKG